MKHQTLCRSVWYLHSCGATIDKTDKKSWLFAEQQLFREGKGEHCTIKSVRVCACVCVMHVHPPIASATILKESWKVDPCWSSLYCKRQPESMLGVNWNKKGEGRRKISLGLRILWKVLASWQGGREDHPAVHSNYHIFQNIRCTGIKDAL